jgi:transposase
MIAQGMPIYIALERVDLRFGSERLGAWVREHLAMEPRSRALFVFVGKRGETMKMLTWDGTDTVTDASNVSPGALPDLLSVVVALQAEVMQLRLESAATIAEARQALASLREENQVLLRRLYGDKTERLKELY